MQAGRRVAGEGTRGGTRTRNALAGARLLRPLTLPVCPPGPVTDRTRAQGSRRGAENPVGESRPLPELRPAHSPAPDRRRVARSLGWFYLGAPLVAEAWLARAAGPPGPTPARGAICRVPPAA